MKVYNKLVRDKIPQIIQQEGRSCAVQVLDDDQYLRHLNAKLQEEVKEYAESGEVEELADIEEVLLALVQAKGVSLENFEALRKAKAQKRGAFEQKLFLISVDD